MDNIEKDEQTQPQPEKEQETTPAAPAPDALEARVAKIEQQLAFIAGSQRAPQGVIKNMAEPEKDDFDPDEVE